MPFFLVIWDLIFFDRERKWCHFSVGHMIAVCVPAWTRAEFVNGSVNCPLFYIVITRISNYTNMQNHMKQKWLFSFIYHRMKVLLEDLKNNKYNKNNNKNNLHKLFYFWFELNNSDNNFYQGQWCVNIFQMSHVKIKVNQKCFFS